MRVRASRMVLYAILTLALVMFTSAVMWAGPPTVNANIVNTPLPVTGNVTGTISGEVEVTNDETNPVPVVIQDGNGAARQPVVINLGKLEDSSVLPGWYITDWFDVPLGQMLVIEYVSVEIWVPEGSSVKGGIRLASGHTGVGAAPFDLSVLLTKQGTVAGSTLFSASSPVKTYVYPSEARPEPGVGFDASLLGGSSGLTSSNVLISGYFEPVTLP